MDQSIPNLVREDKDSDGPENENGVHRPRPLLLDPSNTLYAFVHNMDLMHCNLSDVVHPAFCCLVFNGYTVDRSGLLGILRWVKPNLTTEEFNEILEVSSSQVLQRVLRNNFQHAERSAFKHVSPSTHDSNATTPGSQIPHTHSDGEMKNLDQKQSITKNTNFMTMEEIDDFEMQTDRVLRERLESEGAAPLSPIVQNGSMSDHMDPSPQPVEMIDMQQAIKQEPLDEEFYEEVENETRQFARLGENTGSRKRKNICDEIAENRKRIKYNYEENDEDEDIQVTFYKCCKLHKSNNCIRHLLRVRKELRWVSCDNCQKWYHCFCIYGRNTEYKAEEFFCCGNKKVQNKCFKRALTGIVRDTVISKREAAKNRGN